MKKTNKPTNQILIVERYTVLKVLSRAARPFKLKNVEKIKNCFLFIVISTLFSIPFLISVKTFRPPPSAFSPAFKHVKKGCFQNSSLILDGDMSTERLLKILQKVETQQAKLRVKLISNISVFNLTSSLDHW